MATELSKLKGIGPKTTLWLNDIGIHTLEDIEALGVVEVYRRLKEAYPHKVSLNALYSLQAAMLGIHWLALPLEMKAELKAQVSE